MQIATVRDHLRIYPIHALLVELVLVSAVVSLAGCVSARSSGGTASAASAEIEPRLRDEIARWQGTPHEMGGTDAEGLDCSAFVQRVYAETFRLGLPRSTEEQVHVGRRVRRRHLQAGDLVFFRPPTKTRHVGIYLSDGEFAHVSSTQGVTISELDLPYWKRAYWTSRRVLSDAPTPAQAARRAPSEPSPAYPDERVGW